MRCVYQWKKVHRREIKRQTSNNFSTLQRKSLNFRLESLVPFETERCQLLYGLEKNIQQQAKADEQDTINCIPFQQSENLKNP